MKTVIFIVRKQWFSKCSLQIGAGGPKILSDGLRIILRSILSFSLCWHLHGWCQSPGGWGCGGLRTGQGPAPRGHWPPLYSSRPHAHRKKNVLLENVLNGWLKIISLISLDHYRLIVNINRLYNCSDGVGSTLQALKYSVCLEEKHLWDCGKRWTGCSLHGTERISESQTLGVQTLLCGRCPSSKQKKQQKKEGSDPITSRKTTDKLLQMIKTEVSYKN